MILREPLGVVGAVVPWNFPLLMASWKVGPALAAGNSVVLKPAEQSPLTAIRLGELASEAGIPDGVLQVVPGFGETAGQAIGLHMDVDMVAFTGSTEVGKLFLRYAGESNMKRVALECGGKSPHIVMPDCGDLDAAATAAAWGIFFNQGEVCNAGSRLIVHESLKDELLERIDRVAEQDPAGRPARPEDAHGAARRLDPARPGARLHRVGPRRGRRALSRRPAASGRRPAATTSSRRSSTVSATTCGSRARRSSGPCSRRSRSRRRTRRSGSRTTRCTGSPPASGRTTSTGRTAPPARSEAGVVWVNTFDTGDISAPFGGFKQSGFGRDKSIHSLEKYTDLKTVWIALRS